MTRDDIIRMAEKAHRDLVALDYPGHVGQLDPWTMRLLERFAALIEQRAADAEREACAQIAWQFGWSGECRHIAAAIRARGEHVPGT